MTLVVAGFTIQTTTEQRMGSLIYVQYEGAKELSGIRQYLRDIGGRFGDFNTKARYGKEYKKRISDILGTADWVDWLPDNDVDGGHSEAMCLAAVTGFVLQMEP
jgi:hypothetical protein